MNSKVIFTFLIFTFVHIVIYVGLVGRCNFGSCGSGLFAPLFEAFYYKGWLAYSYLISVPLLMYAAKKI